VRLDTGTHSSISKSASAHSLHARAPTQDSSPSSALKCAKGRERVLRASLDGSRYDFLDLLRFGAATDVQKRMPCESALDVTAPACRFASAVARARADPSTALAPLIHMLSHGFFFSHGFLISAFPATVSTRCARPVKRLGRLPRCPVRLSALPCARRSATRAPPYSHPLSAPERTSALLLPWCGALCTRSAR